MKLASDGASQKVLANFNWGLFGTTVIIALIGLWNLASASKAAHTQVWVSQSAWLGLGFGIALLLCVFDYRHLLHAAYPLYGLVLVLLVLTLLVGNVHKGSQRWLVFGPVRLQASELAKVAVVLALARFYHDDVEPREGYGFRRLFVPALLLGLPVLLVVRQPDLGTSLLILAVGGTMVLFARVHRRALIVGVVGGLVVAGSAWLWFLEDYQRRRVTAFLDPEGDAKGAGYHHIQSTIAIGSGDTWGKGWGEGTQTQFSFLPEQHTDFVFSVFAEEHGFAGGVLLLLLYALLLALIIGVAASAKDRFGVFLAIGGAALIFWHIFVNIGMVTGLLPVVGVTLPLLSYGGSSIVTVLAMLGLLLNVGLRRYRF
ncbi:MAG: rod shape-determining protein RodA [Deltaproteobacteria bacterium]|nr:rod shape-determining protein RodA [Deltaproteobacteria bacterium]